MTIARKLMLPALLGIALALWVLVWLSLQSQTRLIIEREDDRIVGAATTFEALLEDRALLAQALAVSISDMPEVRARFAARQRAELLALVAPLYQELSVRHRVVQLQFHLPSAISFLRADLPEKFGDDLSAYRHSVVRAQSDMTPQAGLEIGPTGIALRGVVPVAHDRHYIGSVEFGIALDNFLLEQFKSRTGADSAVYLTAAATAKARLSAVPQLPGERLPGLALIAKTGPPIEVAADLLATALRGEKAVARVELRGSHFVQTVLPLRDASREIIGVTLIMLPRGTVLRAMAQSRNTALFWGAAIGLITAAVLWLLVTRTVSVPLARLSQGAERFAKGGRDTRVHIAGSDEVSRLSVAFNAMADEIGELLTGLEQKVEARTHDLMNEVAERKEAENRIVDLNTHLERRVEARTAELAATNRTLETTIHQLQLTRSELVEAEKMAALGNLVAGVAHELNTPIGNARTIATALCDQSEEFLSQLAAGGIRRSKLDEFLHQVRDGSQLLDRNLMRAAGLIQSFKQVAVDRASSQRRIFDLAKVTAEVIATLQPMLKKTPYRLEIDIPPEIALDSYPGALGQVIINLIENAVIHGLTGRNDGRIRIQGRELAGWVELTVADDGGGISAANLARVFDPFFTTRLGQGGSGLGLNIVYNIVTGLLGGRVTVESPPGRGAQFKVLIPLAAPARPEGEADFAHPA